MSITWKWLGDKLPKSTEKRQFYSSVQRTEGEDETMVRTFSVGDPVAVNGDDGKIWVGQIVNIFEAKENDPDLEEAIEKDFRRSPNNKFALMRCTLRWFYSYSDLGRHSLRRPGLPPHIQKEIYFSDHVEGDGFNDVQVIEGKAWLFERKPDLTAFNKSPPDEYIRGYDQLRVVRCFVNSSDPELPVRNLRPGELDYLLRNPNNRKDLYYQKLIASTPAPKPSTKVTPSRKRKVSRITTPPSDEEDEDYVAPEPEEADNSASSSSDSESKSPRPRIGRAKVQFNQDEEDDGSDYSPNSDDEPLDKRMSRRRTKRARNPEDPPPSPPRQPKLRTNKKKTKQRRSTQVPSDDYRPLREPRRASEPAALMVSPEETFEESHKGAMDFVDEMNASVNMLAPLASSPLDIGSASTLPSKTGNAARPATRSQPPKRSNRQKTSKPIVISSDSDDGRGGNAASSARPRPHADQAQRQSVGLSNSRGGSSVDIENGSQKSKAREGPSKFKKVGGNSRGGLHGNGKPTGPKSGFVQSERKRTVAARASARTVLARDATEGREGRVAQEAARRKVGSSLEQRETGKGSGVSFRGDSTGEAQRNAGVDKESESLVNDLVKRFSEISMEGRQVFLSSFSAITEVLGASIDGDGHHDGRPVERPVELRIADDLMLTLRKNRMKKGADGQVGGETPMVESRS